MVTITIDGVEMQVPKGELIVESAKRLGKEIPIFCYHPRMKPVGMCRMCLVEVATQGPDGTIRKMPKPQAACTLPAGDGLFIWTDSEAIRNDRKGVLEFLLINHPLDCPICDRGGECPLQNNTFFYGPSTSRYLEAKRHAPKAFPLSEHVVLDLERCIQCGRCVRFTEEISGDAELALRFRGNETQPGTFELTNFDSKFSGNTIEICPVGALTNRHYRFRARPWDLESSEAICTICSNGCNVWFDHRAGRFVRLNGRTNEAINEEWTCDRGKFGHDAIYNDAERLERPLIRQENALHPSDPGAATSRLMEAFVGAGDAAAFLAGTSLSNESLHLLARFAAEHVGTTRVDFRTERHLPAEELPMDRIAIADLESPPAILVFGTNLADEEPIVYLRIRKAWLRNGTRVVVAASVPTDLDSLAHILLRFHPGTEAELASGLAHLLGGVGLSVEETAKVTGVREAELREAADLLRGAPLLATRGLYDQLHGAGAAASLRRAAESSGGRFSLMVRGTNEEGALRLLDRFLDVPEGGARSAGVRSILADAADGRLRALWLVGFDPFTALPEDHDLVNRALERAEFLVVQDTRRTEATGYASVVLPMTAPAEETGTYTNVEGRVQEIKAILPPQGDATPAWRTFSELMLRLRPARPFIQAKDIFAEIAGRF